ncbi:lipopolysaccharide biosynthesis protein [Pontibacter qinzhouensis]|uniref:Lipopolysaccharide biosynthesis protein n=1 Tax=Pontibacter qinzhouensis TaxID=2603253 RepID=A0A5C8JAN6_9BACT|nr:lipopolysaccharide biosynthesis protein [Pontibacter qinzhouensis]TXK33784.1 lipopolysaccharide biosynthesis protein [Pontibacter qinzhouensis]
MSKNLASKAVSGLKWGSASTVANAVMQIGYTSAMARLLEPEAFGLVAISGVVLRFGSYFANLGLNKAIVQKEDLSEENIRAAFTSTLLLGLVFTLLTWLLAPFSVVLFDNPDVAPIVRVMSLAFFINGISATSVSLMERNMQFKVISILETMSYVVSYLGLGVVLAYLDFGVWSLVYASLAQAALVAVGSYIVTRHNVLMLFKWESYKPLFQYGSKMSVISFLEFLATNLDTILIGRALGSHRLGLYNRAFMLVNLPMYMLTRTLTKVIFPSFSKLQSDVEKLGKIYLSSITLLGAMVIPVCMGILVAAPEIVYILLGSQWSASVPVLQVLCLAIPLSFITMFAGIVCDAKAVLNMKIALTIAFIVIICLFFYFLRGYGLVGFAFAIFLGELVRMGLYQFVMNKVLELSYRQQLSIYLPGVINGLVIAGALYLVSSVLRGADLPAWLILGAQMLTGAILLLSLTLWFPHKLLKAEMQIVFDKMGLSEKTGKFYSRMIYKYKSYNVKEA